MTLSGGIPSRRDPVDHRQDQERDDESQNPRPGLHVEQVGSTSDERRHSSPDVDPNRQNAHDQGHGISTKVLPDEMSRVCRVDGDKSFPMFEHLPDDQQSGGRGQPERQRQARSFDGWHER